METIKRYLHLSVHQLVDSILRSGDIDDRIYNKETMKEGSSIHGAYQKRQGDNYLAEYPLSGTFSRPLGTIFLQGRADGIYYSSSKATIEEIKSTVDDLEDFFSSQEKWHLGQALCYALMFMDEKNLKEISIKLVYISQKNNNDTLIKKYDFCYDEVKSKVDEIIDAYFVFHKPFYDHIKERDESVKPLPFPFKKFRLGQRELAKYAFGIAKNGGFLFAEAPTGIGKTMSSLYPFIKNFKDNKKEKIFYLTAKSTGLNSVKTAINELRNNNLDIKDIYISSKEKICLCPGHFCNPSDCIFAKGYYSKIKAATVSSFKENVSFDMAFILKKAREFEICPFEFQLDLSLWCDLVVIDYNYFFDPFVYLDRFFSSLVDMSKDMILIDEAHNLIDRGRMMYSSYLSISDLKKVKKSLISKEFASSKRALNKLEKSLKDLFLEKEEEIQEVPLEITKAIESLKRARQKENKEKPLRYPSVYKDFFKEANRFLSLYEEYFDSTYRLYIENDTLYMLCVDPSRYLFDRLNRTSSVLSFSATLSPISYFMEASIGKEKPYLLLPSPFPKENFKLLIAPKLSLRYTDREKTKEEVASYLKEFVVSKIGNYFIYFPSYGYLQSILPLLDFPSSNLYMQSKNMNEEEKILFLENFPSNPKSTNVGLLVLGGTFSEGIDLPDDRLIGVAIVGIGIPQVCKENELIKEYYDKKENGNGFDYAYKNPGINKVMQAVGRLIRSESDVGAALLIDDRYLKEDYRLMFSRIWEEYEVVTSPKEIKTSLSNFYKKKYNV